MSLSPHNEEIALRFYRAALVVARRIDAEGDASLLDAGADAAWRAYGADLPAAVRCDLVLRNFAMLYPAAFAPGPVLGLSGWHEDDPWGAGFVRPAANVMDSLFAARGVPSTAADALEQALAAWGLAAAGAPPPASSPLAQHLSSAVHLVVTGSRAAAEVARAFLRGERLSVRAQVILVTEQPDARHAIGIAAALLREQGTPTFVSPSRAPDEAWETWAAREKERLERQRVQSTQAKLLVTSDDASASELAAARALAAALGVTETLSLSAPDTATAAAPGTTAASGDPA